MYSPRAGNAADASESEVSYWRLLGLQAVSFYAFLAIAIAAGMITIGDQAFYSALTTMTAIFASNLLYMPQSRQSSSFLALSHKTQTFVECCLSLFRSMVQDSPPAGQASALLRR